MPRFALAPWPIVSRALRGAAIGVAVWGIFALSLAYADRVVSEAVTRSTADLNGVEVLGAMILYGLRIAVPASLLAAFVLAWLLRLRRPWIVPPLGLLLSCPLGWAVSHLFAGPMPDWVWPAVLALCFAGAATITPNGRWTRRRVSPAGEAELPASGAVPQNPAPVVTLTLEELRGDRERRSAAHPGPNDSSGPAREPIGGP